MALRFIRVADLNPLHDVATVGRRPDLARLSDRELLEAVQRPKRHDPLRINTKTGKLVDGNSRAYELKRRALDPESSIRDDTQIPAEEYTPDDSAFEW